MIAKAILYPRCMVKKRIGLFLAPFFEELLVIAPSESAAKKIMDYSKDLPVSVSPIASYQMGEDAEKFDSALKAIEYWGQQMGLGESVSFETFYSVVANASDDEVRSIIKAIRGNDDEEKKMASNFFLALSLIADIREDELEVEMEDIEKRTKELTKIVNEDEKLLDDKEIISRFIEPLNKAKERLIAWSRIAFLKDKFKGALPVGESISIKDLIDTSYEGLSKKAVPKAVFEIGLPSKDFLAENLSVFKKTRPIFKQIISRLDKLKEKLAEKEVKELAEELQDILLPQKGSCQLEAKFVLSCYQDVSWETLMKKACKLPLENGLKTMEKINYSFFLI